MEKQKPNAELRAKDIDIIRDINAVDFVLTGLTDSGLIRSVRIETALLRQTDNGLSREINLRKLQQETRIIGTSFRSLINRPFQKNGWIVRKEGSYFLTDEGLKHAKESREELSQAIVKNFRRIPPLNQLPLYNAFRLVSVGITGSRELMDLSFMVDLVGTFEYALEVFLCGKVYIPGQAIFLRAVKEAGRTTCSECSVYVPYKSRQSVKFMMQRLIDSGYLVYLGDKSHAISIHGDLEITEEGEEYLEGIVRKAEYRYDQLGEYFPDAKDIGTVKSGLKYMADLGVSGIHTKWFDEARS